MRFDGDDFLGMIFCPNLGHNEILSFPPNPTQKRVIGIHPSGPKIRCPPNIRCALNPIPTAALYTLLGGVLMDHFFFFLNDVAHGSLAEFIYHYGPRAIFTCKLFHRGYCLNHPMGLNRIRTSWKAISEE